MHVLLQPYCSVPGRVRYTQENIINAVTQFAILGNSLSSGNFLLVTKYKVNGVNLDSVK